MPRCRRRPSAPSTWSAPSASQPVDCWISADPTAFLLVGYGRIGLWGPIARGRLVAGGRKPWLALRYKRLLRNP